MNKLSNEKSSYLLQHADNPVDWYPWGEEAFSKAKAEGKPIFLSIGYSTCHWCHVMAHESFENAKVAAVLNKHFVSIKVDREQRPDIDNVYMDACQKATGTGGWPLSAFLDLNKKPFYLGTYFTPKLFIELLEQIVDIWEHDRKALELQANRIAATVRSERKVVNYYPLESVANEAFSYLEYNFDSRYGGFSPPPKFPTPHNILFLLGQYDANKIAKPDYAVRCLHMCEKTLKAMRAGGIFDHIGGGFSRYSTDNIWLVPHFEKMLYDNALLLMAYAKCYEATGNCEYKDTANRIIEYLMREMHNFSGGFYTAEDADSEGVEGLFYTFKKSEIKQALGSNEAELERFCKYFNITQQGNFEGRNILNTINIADKSDQATDDGIQKLFELQQKRIRPHKDKKIKTSHNGLVIAALSICGSIFQNQAYIDIAKKTADFILQNLVSKSGRLLSVFFDTASEVYAFGEDYAFYIWGLIELFAATKSKKHLDKAILLQNQFKEHFCESGGYNISAKDAETMFAKSKDIYDNATPSYNSVTMHNLFRLYQLIDSKSENSTKNKKNIANDIPNNYLSDLLDTLKFFSSDISAAPYACVHSVSLIQKLNDYLPHIQICTNNMCLPTPKTLSELFV